jgi:monomeric sarcosine oxidase
MSQNYDIIIIGAGAMGSAAAYYAAKAGSKVLLLEQFEIGHSKGSSHGHSRIIRYSYDYPIYVEMAKAAYPLWFALEEASGEKLYLQTGGLDFGFPGTQTLDDTLQTVQTMKIPHDILTAQEAHERFPAFHFHPDMTVLYQPDTGLLNAALCVQTHIRLAKQYGATVVDNSPVTEVIVKHDSVEVRATAETYSASKLIISGGAWTKGLAEKLGVSLPLTPLRCQLNFFEPTTPEYYIAGQFPAFIAHLDSPFPYRPYGMMSPAEAGVKVAFHGGETVTDPAQIDYSPSETMVDEIRKYTALYMPGVNGRLLKSMICLYTMTPDEHFIIDTHPEHEHVVIASPCSGHGFKFSTLIGSILTDLALQGQTKYDLSLFSLGRFAQV